MGLLGCALRTVHRSEPLDGLEVIGPGVTAEVLRPSVRNCEGLWIGNGFTLATQGVGSRIGVPSGLSCGCQCPGSVFDFHGEGPKRPSPCRAAIIAAAAAFPAAIPAVFMGESGIAAASGPRMP